MLGYGWLLDPGKLLFLAIFLLVSWIRLYDTPLHVSGGVRIVSCWWCVFTFFVTSVPPCPLIALSSLLYNTHFFGALL